jgi:hypothetical protein
LDLTNNATPQSNRAANVCAKKNAVRLDRAGQRETQPIADVSNQPLSGCGLHFQISHARRFKPISSEAESLGY